MKEEERCIEADAEAVRRVLGGERQAYGDLVRRHQGRLRSLLSFYCRSAEEVEEFLQEAFVQAYAQLRRYDASMPFYPWLRAIALNGLRMEIRRRETARSGPVEYLRRLQLAQIENDACGGVAEARGAALRRCMEKLPAEQAELLEDKYARGRPLAEIAARLGTSLGALKVRLLRLREALRKCIDRQLAEERR